MIFGKDKDEFDFGAFRNDVSSAAEPLVEAVNKYNPNKKSRRYKSPAADLHESASLFFQAAADTLDKKSSNHNPDSSQDAGFNLGTGVKDLKLDKKAQQAGQIAQDAVGEAGKRGSWLFGAASDAVGEAQSSFKDAKLDKKLGKLADNATTQVKDAKLDKKLGKLADNATGQIKDLKLDKKLAGLTDTASNQFKDLKLDKKAGKLADNVSSQFKDLKLDRKVGDLADNANSQLKDLKLDKKLAKLTDDASSQVKELKLDKRWNKLTSDTARQVKDLKLDKKAGKLADNVSGSVKDAQLDKKLAGVAETVGGVFLATAATVGDTVKEAHLDKKLADAAGTVGDAIKDAHLDKRLADVGDTVGPIAANVAESAGAFAGTVADNVNSFIKDNKLDKKAATMAGNVSDSANALWNQAGDTAAQTLKDAKLDKRLAQAQLPEKFFSAANELPGVNVGNPKKAARQFRKTRKHVLKAAGQQQKELGKVLAARQKEAGKLLQARQKDAQKFIKARRKDIETGKITLPFYEPPKKKGFNWGRTGLIVGGAGAVVGGLAANNARIWSAIPPLESKLPGENRYFRSRQGIVFYKEAGQAADGTLPVVFVHGIGAGNTSYEWLQNFGPVSEQHKVYAYDLLGFGNSDRPGLKYTAEVYIKQLTEFLDEVVKQPAYVVASSLAASYAVQVAYRRPELVHKLVLTSPTGINRVAGKDGVQILPPYLYFLLRTPVIGRSIYSGVASKKYIRSYMENQMFFDKSQVTDEMVEQYYIAAHQPGAEYAAFSFFTGLLNAEIGQTLGRLDKPVLLVQGKQDRQTTPEEGETLRRQNQSAHLINLEGARLLPHWENANEFNRAVLNFLSQPDEPTKVKLSASDKSGVAAGATGDERKSHDKAPSQPDQFTEKIEDLAGKVQVTVRQAQDKAGQAVEQVQDKAGQVADKVSGKAEEKAKEAGANVEQAAKKLSGEFLNQAKEEHAESDQQLGTDKPKIKHLKSQAKHDGEDTPVQAAGAETPEPAVEFQEHRDLQKELKEHREAFLGDAESGGALVEDKDNNGVDDRRMGNLG